MLCKAGFNYDTVLSASYAATHNLLSLSFRTQFLSYVSVYGIMNIDMSSVTAQVMFNA